jgi:hypothetical protein
MTDHQTTVDALRADAVAQRARADAEHKLADTLAGALGAILDSTEIPMQLVDQIAAAVAMYDTMRDGEQPSEYWSHWNYED